MYHPIISDYLGSHQQVFDNNNNKVCGQKLDIFGRKRRKGNNNSSFIPFKHQGQYEDIETEAVLQSLPLLRSKYKTQHQLGSIGLVGRNTTKYTNVKNTTCCLDIFGWAVTNGRTALQNVEK